MNADPENMSVKELLLRLDEHFEQYIREHQQLHATLQATLTTAQLAQTRTDEATIQGARERDTFSRRIDGFEKRIDDSEAWQDNKDGATSVIRYILGASLIGTISGLLALVVVIARLLH